MYCLLLMLLPQLMLFNMIFRNLSMLVSVAFNSVFICKWDNGKLSFKRLIKTIIVLYTMSMLTGGITNYIYHNSYIGIWIKGNTKVLVIAFITFIISSSLIKRIKSNMCLKRNQCTVKMKFQGEEVCVKALLDTGNNLREPIITSSCLSSGIYAQDQLKIIKSYFFL